MLFKTETFLPSIMPGCIFHSSVNSESFGGMFSLPTFEMKPTRSALAVRAERAIDPYESETFQKEGGEKARMRMRMRPHAVSAACY